MTGNAQYASARDVTAQSLLTCEDYTVGWICALSIELAASRAMLDSIHEPVPIDPGDTNSYEYGSIGPHNVVMVSLGVYGTNSAAHVATNMTRSFPRIRARVMVGIGGGAPSRGIDLRLGDVVVGQRIMQYHQGKMLPNGQFAISNVQQTEYRELSSAVSRMKALHESRQNWVPEIIGDLRATNPEMTQYHNPSTLPDRLFVATYTHDTKNASCDDCKASMLVARAPRPDHHPKIFYGGIASGNAVIKDSITRDRLSRELDIICFEMEAAGFIGHFPCLVVRGICDYADSHKSKEWQPYAASAAAAYTKEFLLSALSPKAPSRPPTSAINTSPLPIHEERRQNLMDLLAFDRVHWRRYAIQQAISTTCEWFLNHKDFLSWKDSRRFDRHRGFLWISGKAGSGKSTLMKFLFAKDNEKNDVNQSVASFFFNARGTALEKNTEGMYRSIIYQLLSAYPDLEHIFNDATLVPATNVKHIPLEVLKEILTIAVDQLNGRYFTCYIDALDECDEDEVRDMVYYFKELSQHGKGYFRTCFSSRPYPYINLDSGARIILEQQGGHRRDIKKFIKERLKSNGQNGRDIQEEVYKKADGVFIWVVLVVNLLQRDFSRGRMFAVQSSLEGLPMGLHNLYRDICRRDQQDLPFLKVSLQWLLFGMSLLRPDEFYYAVCSGVQEIVGADALSKSISDEDAKKFIVSATKGLAEVVDIHGNGYVQFTHESVRDFLLRGEGYRELFEDFAPHLECRSHDILKTYCETYIDAVALQARAILTTSEPRQVSMGVSNNVLDERLPFLRYALCRQLDHADAAAKNVSQLPFLKRAALRYWTALPAIRRRHYWLNVVPRPPDFFYPFLAYCQFSNLVSEWQKIDRHDDLDMFVHVCALRGALQGGARNVARAILGLEKYSSEDKFMFRRARYWRWGFLGNKFEGTPPSELRLGLISSQDPGTWAKDLCRAAELGLGDKLELLIKEGPPPGQYFDIETLRRSYTLTSPRAISLLQSLSTAERQSFLNKAIRADLADLVIIFLLSGASLIFDNGPSDNDEDDLSFYDSEMESLMPSLRFPRNLAQQYSEDDSEDDWEDEEDEEDEEDRSPVHIFLALGCESWACVELLVSLSLSTWTDPVSRLPNQPDCDEHQSGERRPWVTTGTATRLLRALTQDGQYRPLVELLLANGMSMDRCRRNGRGPLHWAARSPDPGLVILYIENGAIVNARDYQGKSPLAVAALSGRLQTISNLLAHGADVNAQDDQGCSALHAVRRQEVARLLIKHGADVDARNHKGESPLHTVYPYPDVARLLIENGADVNAADHAGRGPLARKSLCRESLSGKEVMQVLLQHGANIHAQDTLGRDALKHAITDRNLLYAKVLLEYGADMHSLDGDGCDAVDLAVQMDDENIAQLLIHHGAEKSRFEGLLNRDALHRHDQNEDQQAMASPSPPSTIWSNDS